jgi:hypothetical protein
VADDPTWIEGYRLAEALYTSEGSILDRLDAVVSRMIAEACAAERAELENALYTSDEMDEARAMGVHDGVAAVVAKVEAALSEASETWQVSQAVAVIEHVRDALTGGRHE